MYGKVAVNKQREAHGRRKIKKIKKDDRGKLKNYKHQYI